MAVSASRSVHFIFAAFQYFSQFIKPKVFRQIAYACDQFSQLDIFMPPDHIICGVVYGINIFCVYQSFVDIRVSRGACRSLFDIRVSREACCSLFDIRVSRGACRSLFDIRVSRGACRSLFDIRVSREACHSLFIHTGEMKSTRPRRGCPKPAAFHDARLQSLSQGKAQDRNAACRNVRCLRDRNAQRYAPCSRRGYPVQCRRHKSRAPSAGIRSVPECPTRTETA